MKKVLLHIGTGKTGTTSIQHTVQKAFREAKLGSVAYPDITGSNHNFVAEIYKNRKGLSRGTRHRYRYELRNNTFTELTSRVRDNLRQWIIKNDSIILSGDYFGGTGIEIPQFCEDLQRWGVGKFRVLAYVRHPSSYYLSYIQQQLKGNHKITPPETFRYRFRKSIERWQATGIEVVVRPFERTSLTENDVISDFLRQVSDFFGEVIERDRIEVIRRNESISAEGMLILQKYRFLYHRSKKNVPTTDSASLLRILTRSQDLMKQTRAELAPEIEQLITERHRADILWLLKHFQIDLSHDRTRQDGEGIPEKSTSHVGIDLESILDVYDEKILEELLFLCLHESLTETMDVNA